MTAAAARGIATSSDYPAQGAIAELHGVGRRFDLGGREFHALRDVDLTIARGESLAITGRSGSGKSTLLNLLSGIDRPTAGSIHVGGADLGAMSENALTVWRGRNVGIVFQFFQLLPTLTLLDNVMLAMDFVNIIPSAQRRERATALLVRVGLGDQIGKHPGALSGGELQRAAVARALANDPPIIVADEPTGNLDSRNGDAIVALLTENAGADRTVILVTHDMSIAERMPRVVSMADGRIVAERHV